MTEGGFLVEMLASRRAGKSDIKYLWHYLYYIYIGLPLLIVYWVVYLFFSGLIIDTLYSVFGLGQLKRYGWLHLVLAVGLSLGFSVALFHFKLLPYVFAPVKLITSV